MPGAGCSGVRCARCHRTNLWRGFFSLTLILDDTKGHSPAIRIVRANGYRFVTCVSNRVLKKLEDETTTKRVDLSRRDVIESFQERTLLNRLSPTRAHNSENDELVDARASIATAPSPSSLRQDPGRRARWPSAPARRMLPVVSACASIAQPRRSSEPKSRWLLLDSEDLETPSKSGFSPDWPSNARLE